ncbi:MAG: Uma2 family endonuclease [Bryobacteraceae bacterium]
MPTATGLMTVEEYRALPNPENGNVYELHQGVLVEVCRPKEGHSKLQHRLHELLQSAGHGIGVSRLEFAFRAQPEFELRAADVGFVSRERYRQIHDDDNLRGAPELVVEILSPSNTKTELDEKEELCLTNGCVEFWVINPKRRTIEVTVEGQVHRYKEGDFIDFVAIPGKSIQVSDVFSFDF